MGVRVWGLALAVLASVCGCTGGVGELPKASKEFTGAQPFDVLKGEEMGMLDHARLWAHARCMADAGYPQVSKAGLTEPRDAFDYLKIGPGGGKAGWPSEEIARAKGFGADQDPPPAKIVSSDPAYDALLVSCEDKAWKALGDDAKTTYDQYHDLVVNKVVVEYHQLLPRDDYHLYNLKAAECLEEAGFPAAGKNSTLERPSDYGVTAGGYAGPDPEDWRPQQKPGTVQVGPKPAKRVYVPTERESDLAVAFHKCNTKLGRIKFINATELEAQQKIITKYKSQLAAYDTPLESLAHKATTLTTPT
ncbi:hypothetical protein [Actinocorallia sp. A-T 12471]|uniref:hypothetical protein n=1 Tax=Actinocorallia sp. A-T 12471 TaxID=3089813 RepID=UPI0029D26869|nr:hypothetical protein [Actinocorallia sp. A-T 12471]MDX6744622.1 hypothetical protein [Actinocorallia sp. A-T 12471]